jgi:nitroreductase
MTPPTSSKLSALLQRHRSIRRFKPDAIDPTLLDRTLQDAFAGASSSGNLNMVSVVRTRDVERKRRLCEMHFGQPMIEQAPLVLTFCADTWRTRQWLQRRGARLNFDNLLAWHVAAFDALIVAQTMALALESEGLGICYMGTTLHAMREIADFLDMPPNCLPVTSLVVGWPDETPAQRDRLPMAAWCHDETYHRPDGEAIDALFHDREVKGWARYQALHGDFLERVAEMGVDSLAKFYTSDLKYAPQRYREDSEKLRALLAERGFLP